MPAGMMKMCLYLDAHRLGFFHRFYSANMVSVFRFQKRQSYSSILKLNDIWDLSFFLFSRFGKKAGVGGPHLKSAWCCRTYSYITMEAAMLTFRL